MLIGIILSFTENNCSYFENTFIHSSLLALFLICSILFCKTPFPGVPFYRDALASFVLVKILPILLSLLKFQISSPCDHLLPSEASSFLKTLTVLHLYITYNTSCIVVFFLLVLTISRLVFLRPWAYISLVFYASWLLVLRLL